MIKKEDVIAAIEVRLKEIIPLLSLKFSVIKYNIDFTQIAKISKKTK